MRKAAIILAGALKNYDPEFKSFLNINSQEDLNRLATRVVKERSNKEIVTEISCNVDY